MTADHGDDLPTSAGPKFDAVVIGAGSGGAGAEALLRLQGLGAVVVLEQADQLVGSGAEPIRLGSRVTAAAFDEPGQLWQLEVAGQPSVTTRIVVVTGSAVGAFPITGRDGEKLRSQGNTALRYRGIAVPGFPNLCQLAGSVALQPELAHLDRVLTTMQRRHSATFELTDAAGRQQPGPLARLTSGWRRTQGSRFPIDDYYFQRPRSATVAPQVFQRSGREAGATR